MATDNLHEYTYSGSSLGLETRPNRCSQIDRHQDDAMDPMRGIENPGDLNSGSFCEREVHRHGETHMNRNIFTLRTTWGARQWKSRGTPHNLAGLVRYYGNPWTETLYALRMKTEARDESEATKEGWTTSSMNVLTSHSSNIICSVA